MIQIWGVCLGLYFVFILLLESRRLPFTKFKSLAIIFLNTAFISLTPLVWNSSVANVSCFPVVK